MPQYDINLREYWRILKKRKFVVVVVAIVLGLFSTVFAILKAPTPLYTSASTIEFESGPGLEGIYSRSISLSRRDDVETQITVIKSYPVFQKVAQKLHLIPADSLKEDGTLKDNIVSVIESLKSKVEVERETYTSIINIIATDTSAVFAQKLANTVALTYKEVHAEEQIRQTKEALKYISEQLRDVQKRLRESEDEFNRFTQEHELISIDLQSENLLARAQEIQDEIRGLHEDKRELEGMLQRLNQFIENPSGSGQDFYSAKANTQYQSTHERLVSLLLKRDTLLKDFTPKHPEVLAISYEIIENVRKMVILLRLQISGIEKKERDLSRDLEKVEKKTKVLMDKKLEFNRLKRKVELYTDMTALLEKKNQEALIKRAERPEEVNIVKPGLLPTHPIISPKTAATGAMGVIIGLVLGMVIAFVVETFDTSLGAIEDVEETLGTQVLGIVPQADIKDMIEGLRAKYPEGISLPGEKRMGYLVSHFVPKSMMAESFRALRTNVQFKDTDKKIKAIAVTSSSPQEGKTLVAINLAVAMAQARMKVLLIGSDLRKPTLDKVFDLEMTPGLTDILMENYHWRDTVKTVMDMVMGELTQTQIIRTPGLDNLHVITSGPIPPNPAELIDSQALTNLIDQAQEEYDLIIFDSPPILSTADAAILGAKVDGVLLVYRVGSVSRGLLKRSMAQLEQVKSNILGVILNGMRPEVSPDFQDYKYYSYYYSYGEEGRDKKRRDPKKRWPFLGRKGESERGGEPKASIEAEQKKHRDKETKLSGRGRFILLFVAAALLAAGILWQNGVIGPFKGADAQSPAKKDEMKRVAKKGAHPETGIKVKPKPVPAKPKNAMPVDEPKVKQETPIPESQPKRRFPMATQPPATKKQISKQTLKKEPENLAKKPKSKVSQVRPAPGIEVPVPQSRPAPDVMVVRKSPAQEERPSKPSPVSAPLDAQKPGPEMQSPAPVKEIVSYPYSLLLYHFRSLERAKDAVSLYSKKGFCAYWVKVELSSGLWYRVFVGHFQNREEADRFRRENGLDATIKKTIYANLIGHYPSSHDAGDKIRVLKNLGYSTYVISDGDGRSRLFVGTFITKEGAEKQHQDLASNGIQSQVVER